MVKRHHSHYSGTYTHHNRKVSLPTPLASETTAEMHLSTMAINYLWTGCATLKGNYVALATVFLVVLLSFILPDISQKIHRTSELNAMKKVLMTMSKEVSRAEVACLTVADELCCLHCSMHDDTTETFKDQRDLSVCTSGLRTTQSEPVQVEKKIGFFRRIFFPRRNTSRKMKFFACLFNIVHHYLAPVITIFQSPNRKIFEELYEVNRSHKPAVYMIVNGPTQIHFCDWEITIMSYLYTDSFDADKSLN